MKYITVKQLENNLSHYLELSKKEDVYVMENDEIITVLTSPDKQRLLLINDLAGSLGKVKEDVNYNELLSEALADKHLSSN